MIPPLMINKADCEKAYEIIRESVIALTGDGVTVEFKNEKQERKIS
jgi:hypothetical protein